MRYLIIFGLLIVTTALEACGDAVIRMGLYNQATLPARIGLFALGTLLLLGYGTTLNLAPQEFGKLIGAYVATFFVMAQIINLIFFRTPPSLPILVGGAFILAGGAIVTFWQPALTER
jgi:small multidrug resistance family-3 protein